MPVHLFGRPAAARRARRSSGCRVIEDAAQAFGAPRRSRRAGVASTYSFFPTKNLFCLGDGGLVASTTTSSRERVRMLRFHGSRDKKSTSSSSATTRASTSCRRRCCGSSCRSSTSGTALRREAAARVRRARARRARRAAAWTSPATSTTCSSAARPSATGSATALAEAGIGTRRLLHAAAPPAAGARATSATGAGILPETEQRARENFSVPLWAGHRRPSTQEQVVDAVRAAATVGAEPHDSAGHPAPALAARRRRGASSRSLVARVPAALRPRRPAVLRDAASSGRS